MGIVFTEKDLEEAGYVEVRPGVFAKAPTPVKAAAHPALKQKPPGLAHIKAATKTIGGKTHHFRSGWEVDYAKYCEFRKRAGEIKDWFYEPQTFEFPVKKGSKFYLPDFKIIELDGSHCWKEVKGYLDQKGATKLKRMAKYYPGEKLDLVRKEEITQIRESGILELSL